MSREARIHQRIEPDSMFWHNQRLDMEHARRVEEACNRLVELKPISYAAFMKDYTDISEETAETFSRLHTKTSFESSLKNLREDIGNGDASNRRVSLGQLTESFRGHMGQLEEDVAFDGIDKTVRTTRRIKILSQWIGPTQLTELQGLGLIPGKFDAEKEISVLQLSLMVDIENAVEALADSEVDSEEFEKLQKLSQTSKDLRRARNEASGLVVY